MLNKINMLKLTKEQLRKIVIAVGLEMYELGQCDTKVELTPKEQELIAMQIVDVDFPELNNIFGTQTMYKQLKEKFPDLGTIRKFSGEYGLVILNPDYTPLELLEGDIQESLVYLWDCEDLDIEQFGFFEDEIIEKYTFKYINIDEANNKKQNYQRFI